MNTYPYRVPAEQNLFFFHYQDVAKAGASKAVMLLAQPAIQSVRRKDLKKKKISLSLSCSASLSKPSLSKPPFPIPAPITTSAKPPSILFYLPPKCEWHVFKTWRVHTRDLSNGQWYVDNDGLLTLETFPSLDKEWISKEYQKAFCTCFSLCAIRMCLSLFLIHEWGCLSLSLSICQRLPLCLSVRPPPFSLWFVS